MLKQWIERSVVLWEMTMSREVLEILEKMDKKDSTGTAMCPASYGNQTVKSSYGDKEQRRRCERFVP
jgi:hypothetical protein